MYYQIKNRIYKILSVSNTTWDMSWFVDIFIIVLILLNGLAIFLASVPEIYADYGQFFDNFEVFSVMFFTLEYILRIWTANTDPKFNNHFKSRMQYAMTPLAIIDLLAILPYYLPFVGLDLRILRLMRLFRLFRLLKIIRYIKALSLIEKVLRQKKDELIIAIAFAVFILLLTSAFMYYLENEAQPKSFTSIPTAMWWGIATLTTVGYGDVYPITPLGKLFGGMIAIIGIGLFALPAGILASGFSDEISRKEEQHKKCPHCDNELD